MADNATITMRAAYTAQAFATMGACPIWDAALADYLRKEALDFSDYEFGRYAAAREESGWAACRLERKFGKAWKKNEEAQREWEPIDAKFRKDEEAYFDTFSDPLAVAAQALVDTPAPTLAATLFKVQVISRQELNVDIDIGVACMDTVAGDMARSAA